MAFWNSQTLEKKLKDLVPSAKPTAIDCNSITLHMGREVYVTPTLEAPSSHTKVALKLGQAFTIPAGQFAFLLTEESISVPTNAMAFISMKAKIKFRGLINVSGFHVDPGYSGKLIFSVFNAGPATIHLQQGMPMFLIWYADLGPASEKHKNNTGATDISPDLINSITGELNSFESLNKKIDVETESIKKRLHKVELWQVRIRTAVWIILGLVVGIAGDYLKDAVTMPPAGSKAVMAPAASSRQTVEPAITTTLQPKKGK